METPVSSPKIVPRKKKMTISESALLTVARIVGNQQDILQKWLRRRDALHKHRTPVASGEVGELHARGPNVMRGYYRAAEATAAAIDDEGWFNTGDLARFEGEALFIVGRTKELIIRSGFNVYPAEVEAVLSAHPAVVQSAVIGRAVHANEEVVAYVQLLPGASATTDELMAHATRHLTAYKRPSEIVILEALPASSTGKILKHRLTAAATAEGKHHPTPATA